MNWIHVLATIKHCTGGDAYITFPDGQKMFFTPANVNFKSLQQNIEMWLTLLAKDGIVDLVD